MTPQPNAADKDTLKGDARDERLSGPQRVKHRHEERIRKQMYKEALDRCHETRDVYLACSAGGWRPAGAVAPVSAAACTCAGRSISLAWTCRTEFRGFNDCLKQ